MANSIKVLAVDNSPVFLNYLSTALNNIDGIDVVATAATVETAREKVVSAAPDVVTLDVDVGGIGFLKTFTSFYSVPVVVVTDSQSVNSVDAMNAGAVEFIRKPSGTNKDELDKFILRMATIIRYARITKLQPRKTAAKPAITPQPVATPIITAGSFRSDIVIALGASTGGTDALVEVVKNFPADTPPVLITQHMPPTFTKMFAERIDRISAMSAKEAEDGDRLKQGQIIVAAGGLQMRLEKDHRGYYISSKPGEKVSGHCPSVDVLFESVAKNAGADAIGAILTGMGADGAEGLLKMRRAGAYTIGQDEETCVVYGMPCVAFKKGAVITQLPLQKIAEHIISKAKK
ncbi:MAG: chemotaxis-specific protein-glutamate methyltransferase CheB [Ruminiclostridium sp.]|nr:chemotaxis-specific protein-glutamate methyltransferase CheB [Ruminiclostridium sp.]